MLSAKLANKLENLRTTVLENHLVFSANFEEDLLERRFSKEKIYAANVKIEFSKDPERLSQYYAIREAMYKTMLDYHEPIHVEEEKDRQSELLLVSDGDACVGRARLTLSKPDNRIALPMETDAFKLKDILAGIDMDSIVYSEVSRVALLPKYADGEIIGRIYKKLVVDKKDSENAKMVFFATYPIHARKVRQIAKSLGFAMTRINIDIPKHFDVSDKVKLNLYAWDLTSDSSYIERLKAIKPASAEELVKLAEKDLIPELV